MYIYVFSAPVSPVSLGKQIAELKLMTAELRKIVSDVNQRNKVPEKFPFREKRKCWTCNSERHIQRECPTFKRLQNEQIRGNEEQSGL